ncbi:uncharacterized protein LOC143373515 [Andrena cerasifolii]|uniref:uncharacterized protein LOC143373515 n=1 Tax=Andrena cerasifolii TaxID=2819439 RepID=UPI00403788B1
MDEHRQAISLANSYFALVDGLASGLESHLSEDVVLDWFGRRITGRRCVTAFIQAHKVNSRHMFTDILPTAGIGYKKKYSSRKRSISYRSAQESRSVDIDKDNADGKINKQAFQESSEMTRDVAIDFNQNEIDPKGITAMEEDTFYDLCEGDLSNLFKLDISSANIEEIERSINRIKLEEDMAPTVKAIKRECGQGNGPPVVETSTVKYVEANGQLEFSRKFWKRDAWDAYHLATSNVHTWRRPCKLQIAYSTLTEPPSMEPHRKSKCASRFGQSKVRLPNLEEINKISNRLVPNTNDFGGFLKHVDFFEDRQSFLQNFGIEMATKSSFKPTFNPQYVENRLVFNKPCINADDRDDLNRKKFVFNYQIHWIIYEGSNKCRMNLLSEFEQTKA